MSGKKTAAKTSADTAGEAVRAAAKETAEEAGKPTTHEICSMCPSLCCKNLSMMIYRPESRAEVEDLKWELQFDTVKVYIRNNRWYELIEGRCMYLGEDGRCTQYKGRPNKCRRHNPPDCEFFGQFYDVMISTPDELEAYLDSKRRRKKTGTERPGCAA